MPTSSKPVIEFQDQRAFSMKEYFSSLRNNPHIICFDNAATTQVPDIVQEAVQDYHNQHANPGRGAYEWAEQAEEIVAQTRRKISDLVGLESTDGIIFTSGTTMSLNMVVECWAKHNLKPEDEVLYCDSDHNSMVLPWKKLADEKGIKLLPYRLHANGSINLEDLKSNITEKTKLCCITHINNTAGWINDIAAIRDILPQEVLLNVDAAQGISHILPNMTKHQIDFLSFSGHKMFALGGIGALCVSERVRHHMHPLFHGGGMAEYKESDPFHVKMEAGTLNMAGIVSLNAACDFIGKTRTHNPMPALSKALYQRLLENPRIDLLYEQKSYALDQLSGIATFTIEGLDSGEVADILAEQDIFVRAGRHCAGVQDSIRISIQLYNTEDEIHRACDLLNKLSNNCF